MVEHITRPIISGRPGPAKTLLQLFLRWAYDLSDVSKQRFSGSYRQDIIHFVSQVHTVYDMSILGLRVHILFLRIFVVRVFEMQ